MYDLYLAQYTHKYGNGYAIIGARNAEQVSSILRNQGRFKDAIIVACKKIELPTPPDGDMQLMIEGAVTTIGNSAYDIAVSLGFKGTKEEWLESMKGPKGDPGPAGSYIAGKGIDITDDVISVIESGSKVSYTPDITEGTKLGTLNIDDRDYSIYSPTPVDAYTKSETDDLLDAKQDTISAGDGIGITNNVVSVDNTIAKKADVYTKTETNSLLNNKQDILTAGENIEIDDNVISVPREVALNNIQSSTDNTAINIGNNPERTRDNIYITAWGNRADANITMLGGDANNLSFINIDSEKFTYNDKNISVDPTTQPFSNNASLTLADNTIYTASETISTLTITGATGTSVVSFDTASSGSITVTLPNSIKFAETPTFSNSEHWEIAIRGGYAVYSKFDLV